MPHAVPPRNHPPRSLLLLLTMLLSVVASVAHASDEATFHGADWSERQVGEGLLWRHYEFDSLFGARQNVSYLKADLNHPAVEVEIPHLVGSLQRTSTLVPAQAPNALAAVNGTYFSWANGGGQNTYLRIDGEVIPQNPRTKGVWGHHGGLARDASQQWSVIAMPGTANEWDDNETHPTIVANGPLLLLDGAIAQSQINSAGGTHCTGRHPRTAAGLTADNHLILLTADGRTDRGDGMTCTETAMVLLWLGCHEALNMDGGGTTTMWVRGEPANGVVNYPSDSAGERVTANAIAVATEPAEPAPWDARLVEFRHREIVAPGERQTVTATYENIGAEPWSAGEVRLVTSRPGGRSSDLHGPQWVSESEPALLEPATVAPGEQGTFTFPVTAPLTEANLTIFEHFMLTREGIGRFGPSDARARLKLVVTPGSPDDGETFLVEVRSGGQNHEWYSDSSGFLNSSASTNAPGTTFGIGTRWASTYRSQVGLRTATWTPNFETAGRYHVSVAWPAGATNRKDPITYHVDHAQGRDTFLINQQNPGDTWYPLGTFHFADGQGSQGRVVMTNESIDESGTMWSGPVRFILMEEASAAATGAAVY